MFHNNFITFYCSQKSKCAGKWTFLDGWMEHNIHILVYYYQYQ